MNLPSKNRALCNVPDGFFAAVRLTLPKVVSMIVPTGTCTSVVRSNAFSSPGSLTVTAPATLPTFTVLP